MAFLDTRHKKKSFTLTTIVLSVLFLVLFYIGLTYLDPPAEKGIAINFGTTNYGSGRVQKKAYRPTTSQSASEPKVAPKSQQSQPTSNTQKSQKILTNDSQDEVVMQQRQKITENNRLQAEKKAKAKADRIAKEKEAKAAQERKAQEEKKKKLDALINGIGKGESSSNQGNDQLPGDKGSKDGNPYATSYYGAPGTGAGGGYGLNGRSLVKSGKVTQKCNEEGRVVVEIVVNRNGQVIKATPGVRGTTNNANCLLEPAKQTALLHRWNLDGNAPQQQIGFVVVNFKLGQ